MGMISTLDMSHAEWLENRREGLGGSDIATVLGLNKWHSPYQLWLEKTGQIELEFRESEPAYWGNVLEEVVANEFQERTGKKVRRRNQVFIHTDYPFLRANIDRDVVGENAILECKTANAYLAKDWEEEEIPLAYICQVQHYMNVLNRDYAYIAVLIGGQKFIWKKIERDQELIDLITTRLIQFWTINVEQMIEPEIDGSEATTNFIKELTQDIEDNEVILSSEYDELIESQKQIRSTIKNLEKESDKISNQLKLVLKDKNASIAITPKNVISFREQTRTSMNRKLVEAKYPEIKDNEEFYKESKFRKLTIKEIG
ncbi:YqaJ viral recombinase family protein [Vagococcus sp. DIV0080]|uniref:YqaJ viral recombinase family protein n=1 Tax=Candidatus Vagococcus giribetii TaxID=2230876 RepID=A0ABS3HW00_9ENTE|nr:YqaJ viral recombinase family protein [Vagococcus sp. DIV0080]MBO0477931.1 YqaJ viral recombinase family protein [Vagococcus sp. DIV0080]